MTTDGNMQLEFADAVAGLAFVAVLFLFLGGIAKLRSPQDASLVLAHAHLPSSWLFVRGMGCAEILTGAMCMIAGWQLAWLIASLIYLAFSGFLIYLLANGITDKGCGCLGTSSEDSRVGYLHVILDLAAVPSLGLAWVADLGASWDVVSGYGMFGIPFLLSVILFTYLVYLAVSYLPRLTPSHLNKGGAPGHGLPLHNIRIARPAN